MSYEYLNESMKLLQNGSMVTAVNTLMEQKMGGFWYLIFFGVPAIMIWLKTESITATGIYIIWTVALFGTYMTPEGIGAEWVTYAIVATVTILLFKSLSPAK